MARHMLLQSINSLSSVLMLVLICRAHGEEFTGKESPSDHSAYIHSTLKCTGLFIEIDDMDKFMEKPQLVLAMLVELSKLPGNRGVG